ncbi:IS481 family transposase [Janthinobacterium sp. RT4P48]|uniref:IS481 family transposase n=1 Tax=Janthinobacterium sp. RT4P48 TaxID=3424188 RepID=UPI003F26E67E
MPWKETTLMSTRLEFVLLAQQPGANIAALCRNFGISRKTAYKWLERHRGQGNSGLQDRSRRPHASPASTHATLEAAILALNAEHPYWGARKLRTLLLCEAKPPHHSTIDAVLRRHGRTILGAPVRQEEVAPSRFEHAAPNLLWQMDFKGHFALTDARAGRCHPLTILDDHSRYNLCLSACGNEQRSAVQTALQATFERYGLPERMTADNGAPWGTSGRAGLSQLAVWLIRLGIRVGHSRPHHPQTQGKDERFHRTLKLELLQRNGFESLDACQLAFDRWRERYNTVRPHEALQQQTPISRYRASGRAFPSVLPPIEYPSGDTVRKVSDKGEISFQNRRYFIGEGLRTQLVAIKPTTIDDVYEVFFCHKEIRRINLRDSP